MKRSYVGLLGLVVSVGVGCGSVVIVGDGDGGSGAGGNAPDVPPNPPECPGTAPEYYSDCPSPNVVCSYLEEEGCSVTYECTTDLGCTDGAGGGDGDGDVGCSEYSYWEPTAASCSPAAVECEDAEEGDVCAMPGDYCGSSGECDYEDKYCGPDHKWEVEYWEDECCYDGCDDFCEGYACPETPPIAGDYCDPCYDGQDCQYVTESPCGPLYTFASCSLYDYLWEVAEEVCEMDPEPGE